MDKVTEIFTSQVKQSVNESSTSVGYQRYEYGTRKPTSDIIIKLCNYFNVSADYLLGLSDDPTRR